MVYIIRDDQILNGNVVAKRIENKISLIRKILPEYFKENIILYYITTDETNSARIRENLEPYKINVIPLNNLNLEKLLNSITRAELSERSGGFIINPKGFSKESLKDIKNFIPVELDLDTNNPECYSGSPFLYPIMSEASVRILTENGLSIIGENIGIIGKNKISLGLEHLLDQYKPQTIVASQEKINFDLSKTISESDILFLTNYCSLKEIKQGSIIVNANYSLFEERESPLRYSVLEKAGYIAELNNLIWGILAEHVYKAYFHNTIKFAPSEMVLSTREGVAEFIHSVFEGAKGRFIPKGVSRRCQEWEEWKKKQEK